MKVSVSQYILKVWLTAVFTGAIAFYCEDIFTHPNRVEFNWDTFSIIGMMVMFGAVYSIPCAVILWIVCKLLLRQSLPVLTIKIWLSVTSALLTLGLFMLITGFETPSQKVMFELSAIYSTPIIAGIWFYKLMNHPEIKDVEFDAGLNT